MDEQQQEPVEELDGALTLEAPQPVRKRRPRALWAVLAVVAVAAGALVITSADDEGNQVPGLPVDLAGLSRGGAEAAADSSMPAWVVYVPGDDLPELGGEATAYRLSGDVSEDRVRELAAALGFEGEVRRTDPGAWSVTGDGGTGRLEVYGPGGASWSYSSASQDCAGEGGKVVGCDAECSVDADGYERCEISSTGCAAAPSAAPDDVAEDCDVRSGGAASSPPAAACAAGPDTDAQSDCDEVVVEDTGSDCVDDDCATETTLAPDTPEPTPEKVAPAGPPPDDVREVALDVVAASGLDVRDAIVNAFPGQSFEDSSETWYVTVEPKLAGVPSGLVSYVEVSGDGHVISGNGVLGAIEAVGEYPLLDTRAAIDRANGQTEATRGAPAFGADDAVSSTTGSTDTGGTDDVEAGGAGSAEPGVATDPCVPTEGAADGCGTGGTTDCGGDGCVSSTTSVPCKVQPDGREICEVECAELPTVDGVTSDACIPTCPLPLPPDDQLKEDAAVAPEVKCTPPIDPIPEPQPIEIVLVDAERSLVLLPANDGSRDAYLVPAYRFTADDGGTVDLPAVADDALTGPTPTNETVVPEPAPEPVPVPEPQPCEVLEEQDPESATTHTVQTCPDPNEDALRIGGEGYYVDIDVECGGGTFELGGRVWITDDEDLSDWPDPGESHEGGTFTLDAEDHGTFVGDAAGVTTADFRTLGPAEDIFCTPQPR